MLGTSKIGSNPLDEPKQGQRLRVKVDVLIDKIEGAAFVHPSTPAPDIFD